jgi:ABC-2 type transport system permease protein
MSTTLAIARRELLALLYSPIAYAVLSMFLLFMGILFGAEVFIPGAVANMRPVFDVSRYALFFITPLLTMSLLSDEYRSGRMEMLRTSPVHEVELIAGKFLGGLSFYMILVATTLLHVLLLVIFARPDYLAVACGYFGMLLVGMLFVSVGLFFSSLTSDQIVAAMGAMLLLAALVLADAFAASAWPALRPILVYVAVGTHFTAFAKGLVDTADVVYFCAGTLFFLFLTYLVLESRKWW